MSEPVQTSEENHYIWGGICDGWRLVDKPQLSVIEERMPPGSAEQRHFHAQARQFFYVLQGELTMEVEGRVHVLRAGQGIEIAPGERHQAQNPAVAGTSVEARFLVISSPSSRVDRTPA
jgi:quercetin dioxygenase-like cupin family protein